MYAVIGITHGDELVPSSNKVMAASVTRQAAEQERDRLIAERETWLATNTVQWWAQYAVFSGFRVEEVVTA